jgi:hypothetical protein
MAETKESGASAVEGAAKRARELNERIVERGKAGGEATLATYERLLESVAEFQESAGEQTGEWADAFGKAQARFTRELADALPSAARSLGERATDLMGAAAGQARRIPGEAEVEGAVRGVGASEGDLPIARYDSLNADEVTSRLTGLSEVDLRRVDAYERKHQNRKTIHDKIASLKS